jgi:hypothetical protein
MRADYDSVICKSKPEILKMVAELDLLKMDVSGDQSEGNPIIGEQ